MVSLQGTPVWGEKAAKATRGGEASSFYYLLVTAACYGQGLGLVLFGATLCQRVLLARCSGAAPSGAEHELPSGISPLPAFPGLPWGPGGLAPLKFVAQLFGCVSLPQWMGLALWLTHQTHQVAGT